MTAAEASEAALPLLETGGEGGSWGVIAPEDAAKLGAGWSDLKQAKDSNEDEDVVSEEDESNDPIAELQAQLAREKRADAAAAATSAPPPSQPEQLFDQARLSLADQKRQGEVAHRGGEEEPEEEEPKEEEPEEEEDERLTAAGEDALATERHADHQFDENAALNLEHAVAEELGVRGQEEMEEEMEEERASPSSVQPRRHVQPGRRRQPPSPAREKAKSVERRAVAASVALKRQEQEARWALEDKEAARADQAELRKLAEGARAMREAHAAETHEANDAEARARREDEALRRQYDALAAADGDEALEELLRLHAELAELGVDDDGPEPSAEELAAAAAAEERAWEQLRRRAAAERDAQGRAQAHAEARARAQAEARAQAKADAQAQAQVARRAELRGQPPPKAAAGRRHNKAAAHTVLAYGGHSRPSLGGSGARGPSKGALGAPHGGAMARSVPRAGRPPPSAPVQPAASSQTRLPEIRSNHTR